MTEPELETALRSLGEAFSARSPDGEDARQPGVLEDALAAIAADLQPWRLGDDAKALYLWANGVKGLFGAGSVLPLEDAVAHHQARRGITPPWLFEIYFEPGSSASVELLGPVDDEPTPVWFTGPGATTAVPAYESLLDLVRAALHTLESSDQNGLSSIGMAGTDAASASPSNLAAHDQADLFIHDPADLSSVRWPTRWHDLYEWAAQNDGLHPGWP